MRRESGFTLIELLVVVAVIGMLAAIAIPNMTNALDRSRQKRTMADIRSLGTAIEAYQVDNNFYPMATGPLPVKGNLDGSLETLYIRKCPVDDGWGHDLLYIPFSAYEFEITDESGLSGEYLIASLGKNNTEDSLFVLGDATDFNADILFLSGTFLQLSDIVVQF